MAYSDDVLQKAKKRLEAARQDHQLETDNRIAAIYERLPRLREIDLLLRQTVAKIMAATFRNGQDPTEAMVRVRQENQSLQRDRQWILESEAIDPTDLSQEPICPTCKGSGYMGARMCDCLQELCRQEQKKELSTLLGVNREGFDNFRLEYYSSEIDPNFGASPRDLMQMVFTMCKRYASNFSTKSPSLLFSGGTGLGKTFLSAAMARTVADRGFSVCYETAVKVFSDFEAEKFNGAQKRTEKYEYCDLLIVDDLGTEMTTQFTQSALYTLVNGRILAGLPTIISTNLTTGEIRQRYSPQIASRLLGFYTLTGFVGKDIRILKKNSDMK